jgi:hypothetical protein
VVPKELLRLPEDDAVFRMMHEDQACLYFDILVAPDEAGPRFPFLFLTALRNAVSHALFSIDKDLNFRFWTDRVPKWEFTITRDALLEFLSRYGALLANAALRARNLS